MESKVLKAITLYVPKRKPDSGSDQVFCDYREDRERAMRHVNGTHLQMKPVRQRMRGMPGDKEVVISCGSFDTKVARFLEQHGFGLLCKEGDTKSHHIDVH